ncbi:methyl-accepting chemotaxis protein [Litoribacillus peritrichatus]|uniref:Methyl-accepting chemotaxis protein n=1 Tax=Litoribacillus peritrichatus TaxID=718191 RepID=A0ABP7ML66_9GAMM
MRLATKLITGATILALVPVLISNILIERAASNTSHQALQEASKRHLMSVRDTTKNHITEYLQNMEHLILTLSHNQTTAQAARNFGEAFRDHGPETGNFDVDKNRQAVSGFYKSDFQNKYQSLNSGDSAPVDQWIGQLSDKALEFQSIFIANNPNPIGNKHLLVDLKDYSRYEQYHESYHPNMVEYLEAFGFYDIFIVHPTNGTIVYSVFKEVDFGTSLLEGPFKDSGIADVYRMVKGTTDKNFTAITDFAPYPPSYQAPASFLASPIFDGDDNVGVLIFQLPLDKINEIMTHHQHWVDIGLGDSGETYLIGSDSKLRSETRFLIEDKSLYLTALNDAGVDQGTINNINAKDSGVGIHAITSDSAQAGLAGQTGYQIIKDYRNVDVISAYAPVKFLNLNWAIIAEIDKAEAFASADAVSNQIIKSAIIVILVVAIVAIACSYLFSQTISRPIIRLKNHLQHVGENSDLTLTLDASGKDEVADITRTFSAMVSQFRDSLIKVAEASEQLGKASNETLEITASTAKRVQQQLGESEQVATAMNEQTYAVQEVATHTSDASNAANDANDATINGQKDVQALIHTIESLSNRLSEAGEVTDRLAKESEQINTVVDVIQSIAEQTNLLALNAAIEAARAGEQGRGFAVVADEVRSLAGKTHDSTQEINQMVEALQKGSRDTVAAIEASLNEVKEAVVKAGDAGKSLENITSSVDQINHMNQQIATAAEEQISVSKEINDNITRIAEMAELTDQDANKTADSTRTLSDLAIQLSKLIAKFKI